MIKPCAHGYMDMAGFPACSICKSQTNLGALLRAKLDSMSTRKEGAMPLKQLRTALIMGFVNEAGNFILYRQSTLEDMKRIIHSNQMGHGKVELIKHVRTAHGLGLAEAKDFVDAVDNCIALPHDNISVGEVVQDFAHRDG